MNIKGMHQSSPLGAGGLIIYRQRFHIAIQFYVILLPERRFGISQFQDTSYFKIAVIITHMAPSYQVPAECIKYKPDWLYMPFTYFFTVVLIIYIQNSFCRNSILNNG